MAKTTTFYEFKAKLKDLDLLNAKLKEAQVNLKGLQKNTSEYAALSSQIGGITKQIDNNKKSIAGLRQGGEQLNRTGNKMISIFKSASIAIAAAFAFRAIIGGIRGVITTFSDFESQMAAVQAISGATDQEFKALSESAQKLGASTVFTAKQVGELQEAYARLGFTAEEIISAQDGTIALAAATGESLSSSAETAGSVLRAFGLDAEQTGNVVDVMGASFTSSALNLERFTQSMKFVAPIARAAGFTFEETSAQLAILANNGLSGSLAGNALKNIFLRLGDSNSKLNKSLGRTVQGLPDMINALREMKDESFGLTEATELLDKRSAPAFLTLINNIENLEEQLDVLNNAEGAVSRMAAIRLDTLEGDFTLLKSASEGLGVAIGEVFNGGLRNAIDSLTRFLQGLSQSSTAMTAIRTVFGGLTNALLAYGAAMIALRAHTIATSTATTSFSTFLTYLRTSLLYARTGTLTLSMAMQTLKAAIASTGVGLLVVALGSLVSYLMQVDEATQAVIRSQDRMNRSFEEDIKKGILLNENSKERLDLLRKMKQEYPELIGNIDLEVASNEQLLAIMNLVNKTRVERLALAKGAARIDKLADEAAEDELELRQDILDIEMNLASTSATNSKQYIAFYEEQIDKIEDKIELIQKEFRLEEQKELKLLDRFRKNIKKKQEEDEVYRILSLRGEKTYRFNLREGYLEDLEEYRKLSREKQLIAIDEKDTEIEQINQIVDYRRLQSVKDKGTVEQQKQVNKEIKALAVDMGTVLVSRAKDSTESTAKLGIQLQELKKYVNQLNAALKAEGLGGEGTIFDPAKLRKTENRIKELLKLQTENIVLLDAKEEARIKASIERLKNKYDEEKKFINSNLGDISAQQIILEKGDEKSTAKFIKQNRSKYKVLQLLNASYFNNLTDGEKKYTQDRTDILNEMLAEEQGKLVTNEKLLTELNNSEITQLAQLAQKRLVEARKNKQEEERINREFAMQTTQGLFEESGKRLKILEEERLEEIAVLTKSYNVGNLLFEDYNQALIDVDNKYEDEEQDLRERRIAKTVEMYNQLSSLALDFFNNRAEIQIQSIQEVFDQESSDRANKFERDKEIAEAAGRDTEAMQRAFNNREIEQERIKEEKITAIKRKQFQMDKINSMIQAALNGYEAITKVTAQTGVAAIGAAPIMSAFVAAQIAGIASQKFVGEQGGIVPGGLDKYADGGMVSGPRHAQGGVKFAVGGTVAELEGGEAVINRKSTAMFKPVLSAMNVAGGGKKFEQGGITPSTIAATRDIQGMITQREMTQALANAINTQKVIVSEAEITNSQLNVEVQESLSTIF